LFFDLSGYFHCHVEPQQALRRIHPRPISNLSFPRHGFYERIVRGLNPGKLPEHSDLLLPTWHSGTLFGVFVPNTHHSALFSDWKPPNAALESISHSMVRRFQDLENFF
jgi:hypothetical protein